MDKEFARGEWIAVSTYNLEGSRDRLIYYKNGRSAEEVLLYKGRGAINTRPRAYTAGNKYTGKEVVLPWEYLR